MFRQIYEVCDVIYRLQAMVLPILGVLSGVFSRIISGTLDNELFERFKSSFGKDTPPEEAPKSQPASGLDRLSKRARSARQNKAGNASSKEPANAAPLPTLQPLNCRACGAGVLLREADSLCPNCGVSAPLPDDYKDAARLKAQIARAFKAAARHWPLARFLSHLWVRNVLLGLVVLQLGVLIVNFVGYWRFGSDPAFNAHAPAYWTRFFWWWCLLSSPASFLLVVALADNSAKFCGRTKRHPPLTMPVLKPEDTLAGTANCHGCGGAIAYEAGSFASLCRYCNVANYRAQFVRIVRGRAQREETEASFSFFRAWSINFDFLMLALAIIFTFGAPAGLLALFLAIS